eukprot:3437438-Prymnesium_polylepis.2
MVSVCGRPSCVSCGRARSTRISGDCTSVSHHSTACRAAPPDRPCRSSVPVHARKQHAVVGRSVGGRREREGWGGVAATILGDLAAIHPGRRDRPKDSHQRGGKARARACAARRMLAR